MKPSQMEVSPSAYEMIKCFNQWLEDSTKKTYRFSTEEQYYLQQMIKIMENHIDMLVDYENKRDVN